MGNLVPLLVTGIRDVLWNVNLQLVLRSLLSFLAVYYACNLFARETAPSERVQRLAFVTFGTSLLLLTQCTHLGFVTFWASAHTYMVSLAIMLASLFCFRRGSGIRAGVVCGVGLMIAFWVNLAVYSIALFYLLALMTIALIRLRSRLARIMRHGNGQIQWSLKPIRLLLVLSVIATVAFAIADLAGFLYQRWLPELSQSFASPNYIGIHFAAVNGYTALVHLAEQTGGPILLVECLFCCAVLTLRFRLLGFGLPRAFVPLTARRTELALSVAGTLYVLVVSQSTHAQNNALNFRYFLLTAGTLVFLTSSYVYGFVRYTLSKVRTKAGAIAMNVIALLVLPLTFIGSVAQWYDLPRGYCSFQEELGLYDVHGRFVAPGHYAAVFGSYWDVWPVVFDATIIRGQTVADERGVYPVTFRVNL